MKKLYNQKSKDLLIKKLESEDFKRITCSFYKYFKIDDPFILRDKIYSEFDSLNILGRIYIAYEGINVQISVPEKNFGAFLKIIKTYVDAPIKTAIGPIFFIGVYTKEYNIKEISDNNAAYIFR